MKYKINTIEPFNIPPVDNFEAAAFFRKLTGKEYFDFRGNKTPKSLMVYDLKFAFPNIVTLMVFYFQ